MLLSPHAVQVRLTLKDTYTAAIRKEIGPISCDFTIPMLCASRLTVKYLQILKEDKANPYRWVRYIVMSNSYVFRL